MIPGQPHAAVWLDIPQRCQLRGRFTNDWNIHLVFGAPNDEVNMIFERSTLARVVEVASELLAAKPATPDTGPSEDDIRGR